MSVASATHPSKKNTSNVSTLGVRLRDFPLIKTQTRHGYRARGKFQPHSSAQVLSRNPHFEEGFSKQHLGHVAGRTFHVHELQKEQSTRDIIDVLGDRDGVHSNRVRHTVATLEDVMVEIGTLPEGQRVGTYLIFCADYKGLACPIIIEYKKGEAGCHVASKDLNFGRAYPVGTRLLVVEG